MTEVPTAVLVAVIAGVVALISALVTALVTRRNHSDTHQFTVLEASVEMLRKDVDYLKNERAIDNYWIYSQLIPWGNSAVGPPPPPRPGSIPGATTAPV